MPELTAPTRQQKITLGEMRASGVRGLLIYCSDHKCSHSTSMSADRWPDDVRLSDIEPLFTCQVCGQRGADVRPNFSWEEEARHATISGRHTPGQPNRWPEPSALAKSGVRVIRGKSPDKACHAMKCSLCEDCGWVCETHPDRPWEGEHACTCGAAGAPCPRCNGRRGSADAEGLLNRIRQEGLASLKPDATNRDSLRDIKPQRQRGTKTPPQP